MFFKELINKRKNKVTEEMTLKQEQKTVIRDIDIEVTNIDNFVKVDIKEDCNVCEYVKAIEKNGIEQINKKIYNNILFDTGNLNLIHKKTIYIVSLDNITYNICTDFDCIHIDEHIKYENNENDKLYIDERIIKIKNNTNTYKISRLKHEKSLSTYYVKFFNSEDPEQEFFKLDKIDALKIARETLNNLSKIDKIDKIINFEIIYAALGLEKNIQKTLSIK